MIWTLLPPRRSRFAGSDFAPQEQGREQEQEQEQEEQQTRRRWASRRARSRWC
jgi:hypothetical protein